MSRELDLVLFGATGTTGRLVAEHLARARPSLRWAIAGRDARALAATRETLSAIDPALRALPLVVADARDADAMGALARRTRVACTTVGPYAQRGLALVAACAAEGTHYCDVTGETPFVRASIDAFDERARASGARIVHCCGFDSIPSDLGTWLLHEHLTSIGDRLVSARLRVVRLRGAISAGTLATMIALFAAAADPRVRALLEDPYALDPRGGPAGPALRDQRGPRLDEDTGRWTAPFVMAPINTRVVRRTSALLGRAFHYDEALETGDGPIGLARAIAVSSALATLYGAALVPASRALLESLLPAFDDPDDGRRGGAFRIEIRADGAAGAVARAVIEGERDPGYEETAVMLGESALCLAGDELSSPGGVTTPAVAMGSALARRLRGAGMRLSIQTPAR